MKEQFVRKNYLKLKLCINGFKKRRAKFRFTLLIGGNYCEQYINYTYWPLKCTMLL